MADEHQPAIQTDTVKHADKEYRFAVPSFVLAEHGKLTAEEAASTESIIEDILKIEGQGILVEVH